MTEGPTQGPTADRSVMGRIRRDLVIVDLSAIGTAVLAGLLTGFSSTGPLITDFGRIYVSAALVIVWPLMLWARLTREPLILGQGIEEYRRVLVAGAWTLPIVATVAFFLDVSSAKRLFVLDMSLSVVLLFLGRRVMRGSVLRIIARSIPLTKVFLAASQPHFDRIRSELEGSGRFSVVGSTEGAPPLEPAGIVAAALAMEANAIVVGPTIANHPEWTRRLSWAMEHTGLHLWLSPAVVEVAGPRLRVTTVEGLTLITVGLPTFSSATRTVKWAIDILGASLGLLILGIPLLVVGLLVRATSAGPVMFKQPRVGVEGRTFVCWKFRTMVIGADSQRAALRDRYGSDAATFKMAQDPRVTTVGRVLRRFSIDELPQLVNVLRGEMSLVGPRPHPLDDVEFYNESVSRRLLVKPGMTGLWQVSGRSALDWERSIQLDLYYVENWSLALDIAIMMKTLAVVVKGSGAY